jgi:hypothetical protein
MIVAPLLGKRLRKRPVFTSPTPFSTGIFPKNIEPADVRTSRQVITTCLWIGAPFFRKNAEIPVRTGEIFKN